MAVKLIFNYPDEKDTFKIFNGPLITVGRSKSNLCIIDDEKVSRRHFFLEFIDNDWFIVDEISSHGTKINDILIEKKKSIKILSGQVIEIAGLKIIFEYDGSLPKTEITKVMARKMIQEIFDSDEEYETEKSIAFNQIDLKQNDHKDNNASKGLDNIINNFSKYDLFFLILFFLIICGLSYWIFIFLNILIK